MDEKAKRKETNKRAACAAKRDVYLARILPEMQRLSQELHGGKYAPNHAEYVCHAEDVVDRCTISYAFGKWGDVVSACGMELGSFAYYHHAKDTSSEWERLGAATCAEVLQDARLEREKIRDERLPSEGMQAKEGVRVWIDRQGRYCQQVVYALI